MPIVGSGPELPAWAPALDRVGALVPSRTRDTSGTLTGTFTDTTNPTGVQVTSLIGIAARDVQAAIGEPHADVAETAADVAALNAASLVELTYPATAESVNVAEQLRRRYESELARLVRAQAAATADTPAANTVASAYAGFPAAGSTMTERY